MTETGRKRFQVLGTARPERMNWFLDPIWYSRSDGVSFFAEMQGSRFVAGVEVPDEAEVDLLTARNIAASALRSMVDAIGFLHGTAIDCDVSELIDPAGRLHAVDPTITELHSEYTREQLGRLFVAAVFDHGVRLGLADIRMAIRSAEDTTFLCYRAIEGVCKRFDSWDAMHAELGSDRDEVMRLKVLADPRRHGHAVDVTGEQRIAALVLAHRVLGLYAAYVYERLPLESQLPPAPDT